MIMVLVNAGSLLFGHLEQSEQFYLMFISEGLFLSQKQWKLIVLARAHHIYIAVE